MKLYHGVGIALKMGCLVLNEEKHILLLLKVGPMSSSMQDPSHADDMTFSQFRKWKINTHTHKTKHTHPHIHTHIHPHPHNLTHNSISLILA